MIITNLEYVNNISDLNQVEGGMIDSPSIPAVDIPSIDEIQQAVENIEEGLKSLIDTFPTL